MVINFFSFRSDLAAVLPNVTEQVIKDCKDFLNQIGGKQLSDDTIKALEGQIEKIANPEHKIRELVCKFPFAFVFFPYIQRAFFAAACF